MRFLLALCVLVLGAVAGFFFYQGLFVELENYKVVVSQKEIEAQISAAKPKEKTVEKTPEPKPEPVPAPPPTPTQTPEPEVVVNTPDEPAEPEVVEPKANDDDLAAISNFSTINDAEALPPQKCFDLMKEDLQKDSFKDFKINGIKDPKYLGIANIKGRKYQVSEVSLGYKTALSEGAFKVKALVRNQKVEKWIYAETGLEIR